MGFLGSQSNINSTVQGIANQIVNDVANTVDIKEKIDNQQLQFNLQSIRVPIDYIYWRNQNCKPSQDSSGNPLGISNIISSSSTARSDIGSTIRVEQSTNITNTLNNEISNDTEQSNKGTALSDQTNMNSTAQSISNDISSKINQSMNYSGQIGTRQSTKNIQDIYLYGESTPSSSTNICDSSDNITSGGIFDKPRHKTFKHQLYDNIDTVPKNNSNPSECDFFKGFPYSIFDRNWCHNNLDCESISNQLKSTLHSGSTISNTFDISQTAILDNNIINKIKNVTKQSNTGLDIGGLIIVLFLICALIFIGPIKIALSPIEAGLETLGSSTVLIAILIFSISTGIVIYEIYFSEEGGGCLGPHFCAPPPGQNDIKFSDLTSDFSLSKLGCFFIDLIFKNGFGCTKKMECSN